MLIKKKSKFSVTAIALSALLMTATGPVFAKPSATIDVDYVALGDSLAAGVTPYTPPGYLFFLDKSYADLIADKLHKGVVSGNYTNYGFPLYTTERVLGLMDPTTYPTFNPLDPYSYPYFMRNPADPFNPSSSLPVTDATSVLSSLAEAEIVTLDIGANNAKPKIEEYLAGYISLDNLNIQLGGVITDICNIAGTIQYTRMNSAPGVDPAQIYIMGLYNAFPGATAEQQALINQLLTEYNSSLALALSNLSTQVPGINFVDVSTRMENPTSFTLNNIHPTLKGYKTIYQCFWKEIVQDFDFE